MRARRGAALLVTLAFSSAACRFLWSYDDFKDRLGTSGGGAGAAGGGSTSTSTSTSGGGGSPAPSSSTSTTSSSTSGGGAHSSSSSSGSGCDSSSGGGAGCPVGVPDGGACTDCCDHEILAARGVLIDVDVHDCVYTANLGLLSVIQGCLVAKDLLSMACAECWAVAAKCETSHCPGPCLGGASLACNQCFFQSCSEEFRKCSGIGLPEVLDGGADAPSD